LVRHAPFILPENRDLAPTLFTCVAAHVTFSSFYAVTAMELGFGPAVRQIPHGQRITSKEQHLLRLAGQTARRIGGTIRSMGKE
jgi:hypothetical protein